MKQGQLLIRIDDSIFRQKLDQAIATRASRRAALANSHQQEETARAKIRSAEAQLASTQAALQEAMHNWNHIKPLSERGISTQSNADTARANLDKAEATVE